MTSLRPVALNDLSLHSSWPGRIMGLEPWNKPVRTVAKVKAEYDNDKYSAALQFARAAKHAVSFNDIRLQEITPAGPSDILVSNEGHLFSAPVRAALHGRDQALLSVFDALRTFRGTIVELGCGYGYNLHILSGLLTEASFIGGELCRNGIALGRFLCPPESRIVFREFDYYQPESYQFLEDVPGPVIVFTFHSIEQLPSARAFVSNMLRFANQVLEVIHIEPIYELHGNQLLGLFRKRYAELNDYNVDLLSAVREAPKAHIDSVKADVFSLNPLNPSCVLKWHIAR